MSGTRLLVFLLIFCSAHNSFASFLNLVLPFGGWSYSLSGRFRPEMFYAKNTKFLNADLDEDQIFYFRHIFDTRFQAAHAEIAEMSFVLRNKAVWGNPATVASTTDAEVKLLDSVVGAHQHHIPRNIMWIREGWLDFRFGALTELPFMKTHRFRMGAFPYEVGRGISLGDNYAVGPETLGFWDDSIIDQYAFGFKLYGDLIQKPTRWFSYDVYAAILQNKASNLADTGAKILGQQIGQRSHAQRGFGVINFIIAGRVSFYQESEKYGWMNLEPYLLYNRDPEQFVEFLGDSRSRLGTFGLAFEYEGRGIEVGFDASMNFGNQLVKGWDRNLIQLGMVQDAVVQKNTHVTVSGGNSEELGVIQLPFDRATTVQNTIETGFQGSSENSAVIATIVGDYGNFLEGTEDNPLVIKNAFNRFRSPYTNKYKGWMAVVDGAYIIDSTMKVALTFGASSGDDNPNIVEKNKEYRGFIPLQEAYSGKRVRSAFLFGPAGKVKRPLSKVPEDEDSDPQVDLTVSGFTNIAFIGGGFQWQGKMKSGSKCDITPNVLFYWEQFKIGPARPFLGTEINVFMNFYMLSNIKLFSVASIFVPGSNFKDLSAAGTPGLSADGDEFLDRPDSTGFIQPIPKLGHNVAYTINFGAEYSF
jgi:hypothetical protein